MNPISATSIRLHLTSGLRHTYHRVGLSLVANIFDDSDGDIFTRPGLIFDGEKVLDEYSGDDIIGVTVMAKWPYEHFFERERSLGIMAVELNSKPSFSDGCSEETRAGSHSRPRVATIGERRRKIYTEIEFLGGKKLRVEFSQLVEPGINESAVVNHIFSHSSLTCRRIEGGLSIWNTDRIVSWTNFPQVEVHSASKALKESYEVSKSLSESVPILKLHSFV